MIPEGWSLSTLGECAEILDSKRVPLNQEERNERKGSIPYWGANGVLDHVDDYIFDEPLILIAEDGGYFDEALSRPICQKVDGKCWVNNHAHVLRAKENVLRDWIYHFFVHRDITPYINGGTRAKLNQADLRNLSITVPPLSEQKKITEILNGVIEAIEATKVVIEQTQKVKQGLLQTLLTKGIGHTKFKSSSLGEIPVEWKVDKLGNVAQINPRNEGSISDDTHVTFLAMADLSEEAKIISRQIKSYGAVKKGFTYFSENDVLVAKITPCFENGKGALATDLVNQTGFGSTEFHVIRGCQKILPQFIYFHTISNRFRKTGASNMTGTAGQKRVTKEFINEYLLALPPCHEQEKIVRLLEGVDVNIEAEVSKLTSLQQLKNGLMHDLLTGKVRVGERRARAA